MDKEKQEKNQRWYLRIQEYAESELSQRAWCKSQGISTSTFSYWYRKFGNLITNERSKENFFQIGTWTPSFQILNKVRTHHKMYKSQK